jgi:hypothetical protein
MAQVRFLNCNRPNWLWAFSFVVVLFPLTLGQSLVGGCGATITVPNPDPGPDGTIVDSDGDGFTDEDELGGNPGTDPNDPTDNPNNVRDSDSDGCSDYDELNLDGFCDNDPYKDSLVYHGVATHSWSNFGTADSAQADTIKSEVDAYEAAVGRTVAWVAFGHEWEADGGTFPSDVATSIKNRGATPLIFLNLRTLDVGQTDPVYNLAAINAGQFDSKLEAWADRAKNFGSELIVDWGWEMNGDFTPWNGTYNGGTTEGPRRFREACRHIIELMRNRGATNIRWAFHINFPEFPDESWNAFENYYPGDDVIDIIGASIYSAQAPTDDSFPSFESLMDPAYSRLTQMAPEKPVYVFEFGAAAGNPLGSSVTWADDALAGILSGRWPAVRSFAWWNDYWQNDSDPAHDTEMRVEVVPGLATVFKSRLSGAGNIGDRPPIFPLVTNGDPSPLKTLAEQRGIRFGAMYQYHFRDGLYDQIFETEMNVMTAGTFWTDGSYASRTEFNFSEMDVKVNWGRSRGMDVHGHILVWYNDIPDWLKAAPSAR